MKRHQWPTKKDWDRLLKKTARITGRWMFRNRVKLLIAGALLLVGSTKEIQLIAGQELNDPGVAPLADFTSFPLPVRQSGDPGILAWPWSRLELNWEEVVFAEKETSTPIPEKKKKSKPDAVKKAPTPAPVAWSSDKIARQKQYVERYATLAQGEMKKYGIPASITLAQGLLESDAGASKLARDHNNHFGIKCFQRNCAPGHCVNYSDDSHKDFFRKFSTTWDSYRAHSQFLQRDHYKHLHKLSRTDYKGWAHGLQKAGYATDKGYADKLIRVIEDLKLHRYDR